MGTPQMGRSKSTNTRQSRKLSNNLLLSRPLKTVHMQGGARRAE
jgi:hypothetical protein